MRLSYFVRTSQLNTFCFADPSSSLSFEPRDEVEFEDEDDHENDDKHD